MYKLKVTEIESNEVKEIDVVAHEVAEGQLVLTLEDGRKDYFPADKVSAEVISEEGEPVDAFKLSGNEFGFYNPQAEGIHVDPLFDMNSGSIYFNEKTGERWTGKPDAGATASIDSVPYNRSAIFRAQARQQISGSLSVSGDFKVMGYITNNPDDNYDVEIWPRFKDQFNLYVVGVARQSGDMVVKKKVASEVTLLGVKPSNKGHYFALPTVANPAVAYPKYPQVTGVYQNWKVNIKDQADKSVLVEVFIDGALAHSFKDDMKGTLYFANRWLGATAVPAGTNAAEYAAATALAKVVIPGVQTGVRSDYAEFYLKNYKAINI